MKLLSFHAAQATLTGDLNNILGREHLLSPKQRHISKGDGNNMRDYTDKDRSEDKKLLHDMGYAQELSRSMSRFSNFAISFSIICILSGGINSLGQATSGAGGAAIGLGWPLGVLISGVFALCLAQISSAYPTAGGLYHWGSILGNRFTGWLSAWLNLLGLVTVLGAINVGTYYFFFGAFGSYFGMEDTLTTRVAFVGVLTGIQALINHYGISLTAKLTDFSGFLILGTSALLAAVCLFSADTLEFSRLWTFGNYTGTEGASGVWPVAVGGGMAFLLGLLLPVYTITGYDASAHTSEETLKASISVPKGMVSSVIWSGVFGWIMLCAIVLAIPNMDTAASKGGGAFFWIMDEVISPKLKIALYVGISVAQYLCGLATVTSASRMTYAFARDGGLPMSNALKSVSLAAAMTTALVARGIPDPTAALAGELGVLAFKRGYAQWSEGERGGKDELTGYTLAALDELRAASSSLG